MQKTNIPLIYVIKFCFLIFFAAGKRKFDGSHPNQIEVKRRFPNTMLSQWGCQPQPISQQPLDANGGDQWYSDAYSPWT